jgi:hypothetical protein
MVFIGQAANEERLHAIQQAAEQAGDLENLVGLIERKVNITDQNTKLCTEALTELRQSSDVRAQTSSAPNSVLTDARIWFQSRHTTLMAKVVRATVNTVCQGILLYSVYNPIVDFSNML